MSSKPNQTYTLKARIARARWWKPSQNIAFAKLEPSSAPGNVRVLSNAFLAALQLLLLRSAKRNRLHERLYTRVISSLSASRNGYPRDDLEAQQGRLKHLAAFITSTRFARDAALSPSGRMTTQPSVGTAEPSHFGVFISLACPPKTLSLLDRRVCLCCPS